MRKLLIGLFCVSLFGSVGAANANSGKSSRYVPPEEKGPARDEQQREAKKNEDQAKGKAADAYYTGQYREEQKKKADADKGK